MRTVTRYRIALVCEGEATVPARANHMASVGSLSASFVYPREVYKSAILVNAAAIVAGHNHPSGDPAPSREDRVTRTLAAAGRLLDIPSTTT